MNVSPDQLKQWETIAALYSKETGRVMTEMKKSRSDAMKIASDTVGACNEPKLTGAEVRSIDAKLRNYHRYNGAAKHRAKRVTRSSNWALEEIGLANSETTDEISLLERARLLLKSMGKGETRFEVCINPDQAKGMQASIAKVIPELKWRADNPYRSTILSNEVHQAGEKRILLAVQRL